MLFWPVFIDDSTLAGCAITPFDAVDDGGVDLKADQSQKQNYIAIFLLTCYDHGC
jgi:hypothetical protein